jgi:4-aminobutyrate aminotransferase/(S)-3-amino-2-methylpropionate transaminase
MPLSEFPRAPETSAGDQGPEVRVTPPGPMSRSMSARLADRECPAFEARRDQREATSGADQGAIVLASARGSNVWDVDGNRYVDLVAGFGAAILGHSPPAVVGALEAQTARLVMALGDVYSADTKIALLDRLVALHPGKARVMLGQSGSDAVTIALKTAVLATGKPGIIAFEGAYHGLGNGPLAACGLREAFRAPFAAQLNPHVDFVQYPRRDADLDATFEAIERALEKGDIGAVLVEPILGRGGCVVPPKGFLAKLVEAAHARGALVIADEIWTGLGRSGAMVASAEQGAAADILCFGKGLGGSLPISAVVASDAIMQAWGKHDGALHTSTHAGSPIAIAAAIATLDTLRFKRLPARAKEVGARFQAALREELEGNPSVIEVRGEGLMIGVELTDAATALRAVHDLQARGYIALTGGMKGEVLTFTPPLTIEEQRLDEAAIALGEVLAPMSR